MTSLSAASLLAEIIATQNLHVCIRCNPSRTFATYDLLYRHFQETHGKAPELVGEADEPTTVELRYLL